MGTGESWNARVSVERSGLIKTSTASENQRFIPGGGHLLCIHPLSLCLCYTSPAFEEAELSIFLEHASLP